MKRLFMILTFGFIGASQVLWAIPSTINYQGTLKEKGLPASGTKQMLFRITSQDGSTVYWSGTQVPVQVANGLFSAQITPTLQSGYTWDTITPYMEVSVDGQLLLPREPVNATVYATISGSIVDGAITPTKIASGYGLVPSGAIMMFDTNCPSGWTIYTALQGKFPVGADLTNPSQFTMGQSGGNLTHNHSISSDGAHNHSGQTSGANRGGTELVGTPSGAPAGEYLEDIANQPLERSSPHSHAISTDGSHNHGGLTGNSSSLPPYLSMIFCKKL